MKTHNQPVNRRMRWLHRVIRAMKKERDGLGNDWVGAGLVKEGFSEGVT